MAGGFKKISSHHGGKAEGAFWSPVGSDAVVVLCVHRTQRTRWEVEANATCRFLLLVAYAHQLDTTFPECCILPKQHHQPGTRCSKHSRLRETDISLSNHDSILAYKVLSGKILSLLADEKLLIEPAFLSSCFLTPS